jgi:hypothetical protein
VNNTTRVIQRRSYGLSDEKYPRIKVLTGMRDPISNMKSGANYPLEKEKT